MVTLSLKSEEVFWKEAVKMSCSWNVMRDWVNLVVVEFVFPEA